MGIRPNLYIIVGIDDAKENDPRFSGVSPHYFEELMNFRKIRAIEYWRSEDGLFDDSKMAGYKQFPEEMNELLYIPQCEYDIPNIVGMITQRGQHDSDFIRALATLYPEFKENGWKRIPSVEKIHHEIYFRHGGFTERDLECNRVVDGVFESMVAMSRTEWQRAMHYLALVGWNIPEEELRYLLVWDWK